MATADDSPEEKPSLELDREDVQRLKEIMRFWAALTFLSEAGVVLLVFQEACHIIVHVYSNCIRLDRLSWLHVPPYLAVLSFLPHLIVHMPQHQPSNSSFD